jgi:hypothetical protein
MLDEDKLAALNQEWSSPVAEMLVMFRWEKLSTNASDRNARDRILFPIYRLYLRDAKRRERKMRNPINTGVYITYSI